ncbi:MAG: trehalose-6-phosphate synthase [Candidatus Omnitrophica bacterium]|nr:trehalose-6-phosphate synthase [Candidatus Omnitrophota bacterium]
MYTKNDLQNAVKQIFADNMLIVVSNREPYVHKVRDGKIICGQPTGGAVAALEPVMSACGGTWVAYGSGSGDKKTVDKKDHVAVPPGKPSYILRRVWLSREEEAGYYYGFSNKGLWPLCHIAYTRPEFNEDEWRVYVDVNKKFCDAVLEEIGDKKAFVWIQDYHLTLLPLMLKQARPELLVSHFWHIPWPNSEVFRICPKQRQILEGLLANDLLGFHIRYHCENFFDTVDKMLEARIDRERYSVVYRGHETLVRAFPISVDFNAISDRCGTSDIKRHARPLVEEYNLSGIEFIMFGLDRIDYTKGIIERIEAVDNFLDKNPSFKGRLAFVQVGDLSRIHLQAYKDLNDKINAVVERVNWKHASEDWAPIVLVRRHLSSDEIMAFYRLANICVVSSLHDGMNIVAKEYIASRPDGDGILLLSQFTGAARELTDAVTFNPFDAESFVDNIKYALEMPENERRRRMSSLREIVSEKNIYKWAGDMVSEFVKIQNTAAFPAGHKII